MRIAAQHVSESMHEDNKGLGAYLRKHLKTPAFNVHGCGDDHKDSGFLLACLIKEA